MQRKTYFLKNGNFKDKKRKILYILPHRIDQMALN